MSINNKLKDHILESIGEGVFAVDKNFKIVDPEKVLKEYHTR